MNQTYDPKPGMLLRCVDDDFDVWALSIVESFPQRGIIYTVRGVAPELDALTLIEIENPSLYFEGNGIKREPHFLTWRFVPVNPSALDVFRRTVVEA